LFVEVGQAIHPRQRHRQHWARGVWWIDVSGHRCPAAVGNQAQILIMGEGQQLADMFGRFRKRHGIGISTQRAFAQRQPVRQALAARVQQAIVSIDAVQAVRH
jgi:hypothetical protein